MLLLYFIISTVAIPESVPYKVEPFGAPIPESNITAYLANYCKPIVNWNTQAYELCTSSGYQVNKAVLMTQKYKCRNSAHKACQIALTIYLSHFRLWQGSVDNVQRAKRYNHAKMGTTKKTEQANKNAVNKKEINRNKVQLYNNSEPLLCDQFLATAIKKTNHLIGGKHPDSGLKIEQQNVNRIKQLSAQHLKHAAVLKKNQCSHKVLQRWSDYITLVKSQLSANHVNRAAVSQVATDNGATFAKRYNHPLALESTGVIKDCNMLSRKWLIRREVELTSAEQYLASLSTALEQHNRYLISAFADSLKSSTRLAIPPDIDTCINQSNKEGRFSRLQQRWDAFVAQKERLLNRSQGYLSEAQQWRFWLYGALIALCIALVASLVVVCRRASQSV